MVQIFIKNDKDVSEWILIELQGDLESTSKSPLVGCFMGDLHYNLNGTPILIIGHHILYGKVMNMDKPFAILCKQKENCNTASMETEPKNTEESNSSVKTSSAEYLVRAVINKKLVFKTRPKPIVTNVAKKL